MKLFKKTYLINIFLTAFVLIAAASIISFFYYKNLKTALEANTKKYIYTLNLTPNEEQKIIDDIFYSKIFNNIKLQHINASVLRVKCQLYTLTQAIATSRNKKKIILGITNDCNEKVYSKREVTQINNNFDKILSGIQEVEFFGQKSNADYKSLITLTSSFNKYNERALKLHAQINALYNTKNPSNVQTPAATPMPKPALPPPASEGTLPQ
ncbi:MAG: hypothetical protein IPM57_06725 [Oligoflexia bacterium]|nr:hypothetical protein [Oligoflexia bacterium]